MAHNESATLTDAAQLNPQLEEQIKSMFKSLLDEQIKPLITSQIAKQINSQNEEAVQAKQEVSLSKTEVEGRVSRGLKDWERIAAIVVGLSIIVSATWFLGSQLGGLSSDVNGVREQSTIQFEAMKKQNTIQFEAVNKRFDDMGKRFDDMGKRLDRMDDRFDRMENQLNEIRNLLMKPQQRQTE